MTLWPQGPAALPSGSPAGGKTPPELLAMAVLNFVFGGKVLAGAAWSLTMGSTGLLQFFPGGRMQGRPPPAAFAHLMEMMTPPPEYLWVTCVLGSLAGALLIVSGFGYLQRKRFLGWGVAHAYAVVMLVMTVAGLSLSKMGFMLIPGLTYPVITVVMLNTTLKKYFVN